MVFLTGMEDGVFPHERTLGDPAELAEERRLAYVGVTRARERLYISRSVTRRGWGEPRYYPASRFLDDIPDDAHRLAPAARAGHGVGSAADRSDAAAPPDAGRPAPDCARSSRSR